MTNSTDGAGDHKKRGPKKTPSRVPPPPPMYNARPGGSWREGDAGQAPRAPRAPRPFGDRPSFGDRPKPFGDRGPRPFGGNRGPRPGGYGAGPRAPFGDRPSFGDRGPRPSYGNRDDRGGAAPRPYGDRPRPSYGDRPSFGDRPRPAYGAPRAPYGDRPSFGDRPKPFGDRPRPAYGAPRPYGDRPRPSFGSGPRPSYGDRGPRPSYGNRDDRGPRPAFGARGPWVPGPKRPPQDTSWGKSAEWYDDAVEKEGSYQQDVLLPNLTRLLDLKGGEAVADIACGQGFFARAFSAAGALVSAVDVSPELIAIAEGKGTEPAAEGDEKAGKKKKAKKSDGPSFAVAPAHDTGLKAGKFDHATIILAIQNIRELPETFAEAARVLSKKGELHLVMNHPCFRIPKRSSWGFERDKGVQFRRLDAYLSDSSERIEMHPGSNPGEATVSFHRPLQAYMKALSKAGFAITRLEEWVSNRESQPGGRAEAENRARREFPLFLYVQAKKIA